MSNFLRYSLAILFIASISVISFGYDFKTELYDLADEPLINISSFADSITGTITGSTSACYNKSKPVITFTGKGGTSPYTFVYKINNLAESTISSTISSLNSS